MKRRKFGERRKLKQQLTPTETLQDSDIQMETQPKYEIIIKLETLSLGDPTC